MSRWTIGLLLGFALMFLMNATLIYVAVAGGDEIVSSYRTEPR